MSPSDTLHRQSPQSPPGGDMHNASLKTNAFRRSRDSGSDMCRPEKSTSTLVQIWCKQCGHDVSVFKNNRSQRPVTFTLSSHLMFSKTNLGL